MKKTGYAASALLVVGMAFTQAARADVLAAYDFNTSLTASTTAAGVTATDIKKKTLGIFKSATLDGYTSNVLQIGPKVPCLTVDTAIAKKAYFEFTVSGAALNVDALTFEVAKGGHSGAGRGYAVRSSVDGFSADLSSAMLKNVRKLKTVTVDLSVPAFDNVAAGVTFRIYVLSDQRTRTIEFDDIQILGSVAQ